MVENIGKDTGSPDPKADDRFEQKKQQALEFLLDESRRFVKWDGDVNDLFKDLLAAIVGEVKKDPSAVFAGKGDLEALVNALKTSSKGGSNVSGGDIVGGLSLGDIADFIGKLGSLIESEKKFFLKIIFLIFCNCDCVCKCLCD
jgi:hypothetical protein